MAKVNDGVDVNALADIAERFFRIYRPGPNVKSAMIEALADRSLPEEATQRDVVELDNLISKELFRRMGERAKEKMHGKIITGRSVTGQPIFVGTQHWLEGLDDKNEANHSSRKGAA